MRKKALPDYKWIIPLLVALFSLSSLITLIILMRGNIREPIPAAAGGKPQSQSESSIRKGLTLNDFQLQNPDQDRPSETYLLREKMERWSDEQVNKFWIPLDEIALDILMEENDRRIEDIFKDIP